MLLAVFASHPDRKLYLNLLSGLIFKSFFSKSRLVGQYLSLVNFFLHGKHRLHLGKNCSRGRKMWNASAGRVEERRLFNWR